MKLCDDNHEEVCYDEHSCPICGRNDRIKELEDKLEELETYIKELETDV